MDFLVIFLFFRPPAPYGSGMAQSMLVFAPVKAWASLGEGAGAGEGEATTPRRPRSEVRRGEAPCPMLPYPALPYPTYTTLPYITSHCPTPPCPILSYPILPSRAEQHLGQCVNKKFSLAGANDIFSLRNQICAL